MNPAEIAHRHWRSLLPAWLAPAPLMMATVIHDVSGWEFTKVPALPLIVLVSTIALSMSAISLKFRESMSWISFYVVWLVPTMSLWVAFVLIRAAILTALGRPL
ncbi:MAG: hypothetical protein ABL962_16880 [Fimbriimonadaceae bacterium]